jgi:hypothetical protein
LPAVDGALRLTLLALLLQPVGEWRIRPALLVLAALGLVLPGRIRSPWLWAALATLTGLRVVLDWPMADNHAYLLCWWCLAIALSLLAADVATVLAHNARLLLGLVFAFATLWKVALVPDFLDTRFFRVALVTDRRFEWVATSVAGLSPDQLSALRAFVSQHVDGPALAGERPDQPERFRRTAAFATGWTVALEAGVAFAFLAPLGWRLSRWRDALLLLFTLTTYTIAPVEGFGWLVLALGFSQVEAARGWMRPAYPAAFATLIVSRELLRASSALSPP